VPGRALLDTSAVVGFLRGDASAAGKVGSLDEAFTSIVVIGELLYGARLSTSAETNLALVTSFASSITVLPCDRVTAEAYARLKQGLRAKGRPIPDNDLWIAATAVQHGLTLISRDAHFEGIEELGHESV
jgi:tRNA(fMet)-specific endonuclease VapC